MTVPILFLLCFEHTDCGLACCVQSCWPHELSDWKGTIDEIEPVYLDMCKAISPYEKLLIVCRDIEHQEQVKSRLDTNSIDEASYQFVIANFNDTWCRDYGPFATRCDGTLQLCDFSFDGWRNKHNADLDNKVSKTVHQQGLFDSTQLLNCDFILEGGSIDSDGHHTILTTSKCLLNRHPDMSKTEIEQQLKNHLGIEKVHWLDHGKIEGDDTDGHVDMLARFVDKQTIVYSACNDESHPDFDSLSKMEDELIQLKQNNGDPYTLIPMQLPKRKTNNGQSLPASYVNFLIINEAVLVPLYDDPQDKVALKIFKQCFPNREIIGIDSNALIKQFGSLHCATMQLPAGILH